MDDSGTDRSRRLMSGGMQQELFQIIMNLDIRRGKLASKHTTYRTQMNEEEAFALFKTESEFWIEQLMMEDYMFDFVVVDDLEDACAGMSYNLLAHHAYMQLSADTEDEQEVRDSALHETLEALLMPMKLQAINNGDCSHPDVQRETHAVIHRLTKILRLIPHKY